MADGRQGLTPQTVAWVVAGLLLVLIVHLALPPTSLPGVQDLKGTWVATDEDGENPVLIDVPGLFQYQGLAADGRYRITIPVQIQPSHELSALWIDSIQYAASIRWDGEEIARVGDPDVNEDWARSDRSILVPLPADLQPGTHELVLDVRGDYGEGGIVGRVLVGPYRVLRLVDWKAEAVWLGFTMGLSLLGLIHLAVASLRAWRPAHFFFGLFSASFAFWAFAHADGSYAVLEYAIDRLRLSRAMQGLMPGLALAFLTSYLRSAPERLAWIWLGLGGSLAAIGVVVPTRGLHLVESVQDVYVVISVILYVWIGIAGFRQGVRGSGLLLLSLLPLAVGVVDEILLTQGLRGGGSHLFAALTVFIAASGAALAVRHAEDAERHQRLVGGSVDAMVGVDPAGVVTIANPAAEALLDSANEGKNLLEWVKSEDRPVVRAHLARGTERPDRAEFRIDTKGREIVVESIATPLDPTTSLLVLRDVTRRRQLDHGLLQAARMETVAVLVGGIAHDFNNMLGTLLAHVGFLQATLDGTDTLGRLERMESTIERASLLTRRLLTVAGGTASDLSALSLLTVCKGAYELVEPTLPPGVTLSLDLPDDLPPVLGASADLEHVFVNLLVNARDAVGVAGNLRLLARRYHLRNGARGVVVVIEDDGPGVPREMRDEVFAPFFTTKGPNRGTGLGLAVASQILRDHHGRIWIEDRPGGGARFCVALRHADTMDLAPAPLPEGRRCLLVEDEQALLDSYATALRDAGYEVTACLSGNEAWRILHQARPDILVTDVVMPGISGLELATLCRELYPQVPVLLVSGFIPEGSIEALNDGTWYRLDKPVRTARLVATVGRLCRRAERAAHGELDITEVSYLFPPLDELTVEGLDLQPKAAAG